MPKEGIFGRVITPGKINAGMLMEYLPRTYKILIITLSDRASRGEYSDRSGPEIEKRTKEYMDGINWRYQIDYQIIPDDGDKLSELLKRAKEEKVDVIFPSIYTFYDDIEGWKKYAINMIVEAKKYGKPVIPYLLPQYHPSSKTNPWGIIEGDFWLEQLKVVYTYADGAILWSPTMKSITQELDTSWDWVKKTQEFFN